MQARVGDRLVVRGARSSRIGVILEVMEGTGARRFRVRWNDGHESTISPGPNASVISTPPPRWEDVRAGREAGTGHWRPTIVAGVGREASLAQQALDQRLDAAS